MKHFFKLLLIYILVLGCSLCYSLSDSFFQPVYRVEVVSALSKGDKIKLNIGKDYQEQTLRKNNEMIIFTIHRNTLNQFKLNVPNKKNIKNVLLHGRKTISLTLNDKMTFKNISLSPKKEISIHKVIIISLLLLWTLYLLFFFNTIPSSVPAPSGKILRLEFLRFLFAIVIVLNHTFQRLNLFSSAGLVVEFFFILSGFLMCLSHKEPFSALTFIRKKFIQFFPLVFLGASLMVLFQKTLNISRFFNEIFLLTPGKKYYNTVDWYISVLFWVLLCYHSIIAYLPKNICHLCIGITTFLSYLIANKFSFAFGEIGPSGFFPIAFFRGLAGIGLGYFIAQYWQTHPLSDKNKSTLLGTVLEIGILIYVVSYLFIPEINSGRNIFVVALWVILFMLFLYKKGYLSHWVDKPFWGFLGGYTLAVYLLHNFVIKCFFYFWNENVPNDCLTSISIVFLSLILAAFAHHLVEKPAKACLEKLLPPA